MHCLADFWWFWMSSWPIICSYTLLKIWSVPKRPVCLEPRFLLMIRLMLASMQLKYWILAKMYLFTGRCIPPVVWALPAHRPQPESRLSALTSRLEVWPRNPRKSGNSGQSQKDTNHKFINFLPAAIHNKFWNITNND